MPEQPKTPVQGGTPAGTIVKPRLTPKPVAAVPVAGAAPAAAVPKPVAAVAASKPLVAPKPIGAGGAPTIKRAGGPPTAKKKVGPGAIAAAAAKAKAAGAAPAIGKPPKAAKAAKPGKAKKAKAAPAVDPDGDIVGLTATKPRCWWAAMFLFLTLIFTLASLLVLFANLQGKDGLRAQLKVAIDPVAGIVIVPEAIVDVEAKVKEVNEAAVAGCKSGEDAAANLSTVL